MATGLAKTPGLANPPTADHSGDRLIQSQLKRAGRYVKWVEAGSQLLTLLIATLIFFLAAALIDHWIISLGWFGRWLLCLTFVAGSGWFVATRLLPLLVRAVNPVYSARAIEEATPTLKNSLLNFLLLQKDHAGVKQSVMHALESRAASDISTVEVETAIDRAPLIRMGYILCGVMAFVALYKIASPKDPFQTAARVVAPWSDIARPSRVMIREVQPGHTSVYLGSQVEVTADVQGVRGKDAVRLVYTSSDGQVTDRAIVMKNSGGGNRYVATLPAADANPSPGPSGLQRSGLQQGVQYHIEAGDAISSIYEIRVRMAPTIAVERAELTFPVYTLKQPQSQLTGEIKALEGTRVTIHARANQPIKSAYLELDPRPGRAGETVPLQVDGQSATGGFTLQLKADRVTPWRESYQVRFTNDQGEISEQPVIHKLDVTPDLPPEVEILQPRLQKVDLPEDGRLTIEARGVDPDFALFDLHVAGKSAAGELFRKSLLPPGAPQSQASGKFEFVPADYNLKAGTVVTYQAAAVDNRCDPVTSQPQPGRAATAEYTINITAPRKRNPNEAPNPNAQPNQQPNDPQQQPKPGENKQPMKPGENPPNNPQQPPMPGEQQPPMPGENPMGENKPGENPQDQPQPNNNQPQPNKNKPQDKPNEGQQNKQQQKADSGPSGEGQGGESTSGSGNNAQPGSGAGQPNNNSQPNNNQPMPQSGDPGNSGNDPGNAQNQPSGNGGQPGGAQNQPGGESGGNQPSDPKQGGSDANPAGGNPNVREGSGDQSGKPQHDGEKVEKLFEDLKKQLEARKKQEQQNQGGGQSTGQQSPNNSSQKPDGQSGQPGKPGGEPSAKDKETSEQLLKELEKMVKEQQAKDAREGKSPKPQDQTAQENGQQPMPGQSDQQPMGTPMPNGQNNEQSNNSNNPTGQKPPGGQQVGQPKPGEAKPGEPKPGQQGDPQNAAGPKPNEGGSPQGPPPNEAKQPMPGEAKPGEQKNPGAGENGNPREGGQQSKDPTGSAQGNEQAQEKPMQPQPGNQGGDPNTNEASPPGQGKKDSNTQGATSGDQRGNGKQGPGQSGGAKGNDSAGKSSPGDEGAGRANEQGEGETGNKAGKGPEAGGKTGQPGGKQPGEGTETKPGEKGTESGKGGEPGKKPGNKGENQPGGSNSGGNQVGPGNPTGAGTENDGSGRGITNKSADAADEANLEYTRRVTDLVLQSLRDQEHNPDPELAKRNGLTPQELQEFARRWSQLKKDAENDPAKARELDEALRSLGMRDPKNRRRSESSTDKQRDLRDAGGRTQAPSKYREQFDQFRKSTGNK